MKQVFPNKKHHILKNFTHTCEMLSGVVTAAGNKRIKEALGKPDVRVFGIMLIFLDIVFVSIDLHLVKNQLYIPLEYRSVSFAIALFFLVDVLLRVYVEGRQQYFSDLLNTLDAVVIGVTVFIAFTYIFYDKKFLGDNPSSLSPPPMLPISSGDLDPFPFSRGPCENSYDPKYFHYRVRRIMIDDHNVPTLEKAFTFLGSGEQIKPAALSFKA
ncbi:Putative tyrosine-protein phosphatase TPTE [Cricetulus griseus]|uniref:Putative tyrosine-protein phosphatase TPTE n=1 Tax=Cricetulus griseus TaxID=10029 RepID=G3HHJ6_CRIGR|nr:Putative tyrosine-protein phosphatase TPTE [Cricetulus griseus]